MKKWLSWASLGTLVVALAVAGVSAGQGQGKGKGQGPGPGKAAGNCAQCPLGGFVDKNNDGACDHRQDGKCQGNPNAPDADGDGIPNGQDPDYVPPKDGTGQGRGKGQGKGKGRGAGGQCPQGGFVDQNNNGVCDNRQDGKCQGNPNAPDADGDGIPNGQDPDYVPPKDGSGQGRGFGKGKGCGQGQGQGRGPGGGQGRGRCGRTS